MSTAILEALTVRILRKILTVCLYVRHYFQDQNICSQTILQTAKQE